MNRSLSLFSGIGGFDLATQWVWPDLQIASFCEIDNFCQKILKKHWPDVPCHADIKTMIGDKFGTIDILYGGFPCQPYSVAGKRKGKEDDRALWPEMFRVIQEAKPRWIIGENVAGFVNMGINDCLSDLESEGYETTAFIIPACAVNAPHRRDRVWIVAHAINAGPQKRWGERDQNSGWPCKREGETEGRRGLTDEDCDVAGLVTDPGNQRLQGSQRPGTHDERPAPHGSASECHSAWNEPWLEAATRLCGMDDGVSRQVDRTHRLKALGNAIVPQVAYEIMKAIKAIDDVD